jgi:hypothetical protein
VGDDRFTVPASAVGPFGAVPDASGIFAAPQWNCTKERVFVALAGGRASLPVIVTTPGCESRLVVEVPERVVRGENLRTTVRDGWGAGGIAPRICIASPDGTTDCVVADLPPAQLRTSRVDRALTAGRWTVRATYGGSDVTWVVDVVAPVRGSRTLPRILVTGDSMPSGPLGRCSGRCGAGRRSCRTSSSARASPGRSS